MPDAPLTTAYWATVRNHTEIVSTATLAYFAVAYFAPRRLWASFAKALTVVVAGATTILYARDHCLESCTDATGFHVGPLFPIRAVAPLAMSLLGLVFAAAWALDRTPHASRSALFLSAGLALTPLIDGSAYLAAIVHVGFPAVAASNGPGNVGTGMALALAVPSVLSLAAILLWMVESRRQARDETIVRRLRLVAAAVIVSGVVAHFIQDVAPIGGFDLGSFAFFYLFGVWRLALPLLVVYALVRHHLFDLDWRLRIGLEKGTMATLALAVFFAAAQILEGIVENFVEGFGQQPLKYAGAAVLGVTVYLMYPLQRFVERISRRALPDPKPVGDLSGKERLDLYEEHAAIAWQDGVLSRKERILLDHLRTRLRLSTDQAYVVEHDIAARFGRRAASG